MKTSRLSAVVVGTLIGLSGCSLIPDYQRPEVPVDQTWDMPAAAQANARRVNWQQFFQSVVLKDLINQSLTNNRDLRVAALNIEQAQAQYRISRADLLPTIDVSGSGNSERVPGDLSTTGDNRVTHQYSAGVGFTAYELDFFGRVRSLNQQALERYFSTVQAQRSVKVVLIAEVASAYFQLQANQQLLAIAHQTLASQQDSYALVKSSYDQQVATELDLSQAESTVRTAEAAQARYERQVAQDKNALVLLVGKPLAPQSFVAIELDALRVDEQLPVGLPSDLLMYRPDILGAEHDLKAANANIGAARAAFFPSITLTASAGAASADLGQLFAGGQGTWSFVPSINIPIFNAGRNQANLDVARVQKSIEVANYQKAIQVAFREVADSLTARDSLNTQVIAETRLVQANQRNFELADSLYKEGVDTYLNSLDAQRSLFSSQQSLVTTKLLRINNLVSLYKALGGGEGADIKL
ncbi:outer membrane protein, multidrug efflux system [Pseudomonas extremaustralis]|uniref:efflux transporter outer membrane subunit n=1 Tax=Pseudomonas extremaustralis TaxID=359110 RepID=UPI00099E04FF|nr:efflux transporter outer membrane subunit [Pseudomonas extremaustralis]SKA80187.1 outer membrane protein, multidrug efflux system [Pseudomonas extremaustralis]